MQRTTLAKDIRPLLRWFLHLSCLVIACLIGLAVYWWAKSASVPDENDFALTHQQCQDALRNGYIFYLRTELSSIRLPDSFYDQLSNALAHYATANVEVKTPELTFIPFSGKELLLRSASQCALKAHYDYTLRRVLTVSKGSTTCLEPLNLPALVDNLSEETITAARADAERVLQCGISVIDHQPRECWLKQLNTPKNPSVRRVEALKALKESGILEGEYTYIIRLLEDADESIREEATISLVKSGKEAVLPLVDELKSNPSNNFGATIVSLLVNIGKPGISGLIETLPQYPLKLRKHVVQVLGELGSLEGQAHKEILRGLQALKDEEIRPEVEGVIEKIQEKGKQLPPASQGGSATSSAPQGTNIKPAPVSRTHAPKASKQENKR